MVSIDEKVQLIKHSWNQLNQTNQKVLKKMMKNQFNINLGNFDMGERQECNERRMSLSFVKTSILESLYQEIDMLSC